MSVEIPDSPAEPTVALPRRRRRIQWRVRRMWFLAGRRFKQLTSPMPAIAIEIGVVIILCVVPAFIASTRSFFLPPVPHASYEYSLYSILVSGIPQMIVVAYIAARAGVPRQRLGIVRPNAGMDVFGGAVVLGLIFAVQWMRKEILMFALPGVYHYLLHESMLHYTGGRTVPDSPYAWCLAAAYCLCVGLREEFIFRGYLLGRLQDWMGNRWLPLLISSVLFASMHIYEGYYGMLATFLFGLTMGLVMLVTRRLYAVALAHAAWDFLLLTGIY